jgi:hypothetical protein
MASVCLFPILCQLMSDPPLASSSGTGQNPPLASTSALTQSDHLRLLAPKCECVLPHGKNLVLCIDGGTSTKMHSRYVSISLFWSLFQCSNPQVHASAQSTNILQLQTLLLNDDKKQESYYIEGIGSAGHDLKRLFDTL